MRRIRRIVLLVLAALLAFSLFACGSKSASPTVSNDRQETANQAPGATPEAGKSESMNGGLTDNKQIGVIPPDTQQPGGAPEGSVRKLIRNASYELETLNYEKSLTDLEALVASSGGYVESSSTTGLGATQREYYDPRVASYRVRIPAEGLDAFGEKLGQLGSVTQSSSSVEEITDYYYDTEAHIRNLKVQETRLLELIQKAETLDNLVYLESTLSNVRYQIESLEGTLRRLDSQVSMSTVTITLREVYEYSPLRPVPKTLGERIRDEFVRNMASLRRGAENFIVFLLGNIVGVVFWCAVITVVVVILVRRARHNRRFPPAPPKDGAA